MKKLFNIFILFLLLSNCKDPIVEPCEGTNCPLPDGSYCPGNTINVNNNCVCPEGSIMLNDSLCFDTIADSGFISFYNTIECGCISGDFFLGIDTNNNNFGGIFIGKNINNPYQAGGLEAFINMATGSTLDSFDGSLFPFSCDNRNLKIHGSISNDTLTYFFYFTNPNDTCNTYQVVAL